MGDDRWSPRRATHGWIKFCLRAHHLQAQQAQRRVELLSRAWAALTEAAVADGLDERAVFALLPAFWESRVRRTIYQQDAELSPQQAVRDIREMCRLDWLTPQGQARGRYYVAGPAMRPIFESVRQSTQPYTEPYGSVRKG